MRALKIKRGEWWLARGLPLKIARGQTQLSTLKNIAKFNGKGCSLTFLLSGGVYEANNDITVTEAVTRSIMHAGRDKHDVARELGFRDFNYLRHMIVTDTLKVSMLLKLCKVLHMEPWEVMCDGEYKMIEDADAEPSQWEQMVELNLMGWLDAPVNKETR